MKGVVLASSGMNTCNTVTREDCGLSSVLVIQPLQTMMSYQAINIPGTVCPSLGPADGGEAGTVKGTHGPSPAPP